VVYSRRIAASLKDSSVSRGVIVSDEVTAGGPTESNVLPFRERSRTGSAAADARETPTDVTAQVIAFPVRDTSLTVLAW
jgi:hypothetical protein